MEDTIAMYIDVETLVETKVRSTPKYIQTPPFFPFARHFYSVLVG